MKTNLKIFDEIIKNLDNINSLSFESYKNYSLKFPVNYESGNPYNGVNAFNLLFFSLANGFDLLQEVAGYGMEIVDKSKFPTEWHKYFK